MNRLLIGGMVMAMGWSMGVARAEPPTDGAKPAIGKGRGPGGAAGLVGEVRNNLLEKFDKNGDGKLDADELKVAREEFTKNGGPAGLGGGELRKKLVDKFDKNGDGKLDADELKAAGEELMKQRGANGAGGLLGRRFGKPAAENK